MEIIFEIIIPCLLFIGIPVGIIIFFIASLILLKKTPKDSEKYKSRKIAFIVSSVFAGILITAVVALYIFIYIINAVFGIFTDSILESWRDFSCGFGF